MDDRIQDFAKVTFDMDADFTPLFNWNTKQVFLSLVAEYSSLRHVRDKRSRDNHPYTF